MTWPLWLTIASSTLPISDESIGPPGVVVGRLLPKSTVTFLRVVQTRAGANVKADCWFLPCWRLGRSSRPRTKCFGSSAVAGPIVPTTRPWPRVGPGRG